MGFCYWMSLKDSGRKGCCERVACTYGVSNLHLGSFYK